MGDGDGEVKMEMDMETKQDKRKRNRTNEDGMEKMEKTKQEKVIRWKIQRRLNVFDRSRG